MDRPRNNPIIAIAGLTAALAATGVDTAHAQSTTRLHDLVSDFGLDTSERAALPDLTCSKVENHPDAVVCTVDQTFKVNEDFQKYRARQEKKGKKGKGIWLSTGSETRATGDQVVVQTTTIQECIPTDHSKCDALESYRVVVARPSVDPSQGDAAAELSITYGETTYRMLDETNTLAQQFVNRLIATTSEPQPGQCNGVEMQGVVPSGYRTLDAELLEAMADDTGYVSLQTAIGWNTSLTSAQFAMNECYDDDPAKKAAVTAEWSAITDKITDSLKK